MRRRPAVVDASALVAIEIHPPARIPAQSHLQGKRWVAPYLIDAEVGHALRRLVHRGLMSAESGEAARLRGESCVDRRYPHHGPLAARAWRMRDRLSFYDALYLALAESLNCPLVTADQRLGRAYPGHELIRTITAS